MLFLATKFKNKPAHARCSRLGGRSFSLGHQSRTFLVTFCTREPQHDSNELKVQRPHTHMLKSQHQHMLKKNSTSPTCTQMEVVHQKELTQILEDHTVDATFQARIRRRGDPDRDDDTPVHRPSRYLTKCARRTHLHALF